MRSPGAPGGFMASAHVEVVYARAGEQHVALVEVEEGTSALDAVKASRIQIDASSIRFGRFGREIAGDARVADGDRIEILRPLQVGPMEARRLRARRRRARKPL
jgi:putative ubiquitin-RnfH superfamily antitoxin RatB of RatAB toxin-antitoxin module